MNIIVSVIGTREDGSRVFEMNFDLRPGDKHYYATLMAIVAREPSTLRSIFPADAPGVLWQAKRWVDTEPVACTSGVLDMAAIREEATC